MTTMVYEPVKNKVVKRKDVWWADLKGWGSVQKGTRPVIIIQNDIGNRYAPTTIVAPLSSRINKKCLPTHVFIDKLNAELKRDSIALLEQITTIDKEQLIDKITELDDEIMDKVDAALLISIGLKSA